MNVWMFHWKFNSDPCFWIFSVKSHLCVKCWKTIEWFEFQTQNAKNDLFHCTIHNLAKAQCLSVCECSFFVSIQKTATVFSNIMLLARTIFASTFFNEENNELRHANTTFFFFLHFKFVFFFSNFLFIHISEHFIVPFNVCLSSVFPVAFCLPPAYQARAFQCCYFLI